MGVKFDVASLPDESLSTLTERTFQEIFTVD